MKQAEPFDWTDALWLGCATLMLGLAIVYANRMGTSPNAIGAPIAGLIESGIDIGGAIYSTVYSSSGSAISTFRLAVAVALGTWLLIGMRTAPRRWWPARFVVLASLGLAWVGQCYLMEGLIAGGVVLYFVAAAAYLRRSPLPPIRESARARRIGLALMLTGFVLYLGLGSYELDVHPGHDFDETAYLIAAEMQAGLREPRDVVERGFTVPIYTFAQFRSQLVPLSVQAAGLLALEPGLLALRLTSLLLMGMALMCAAIPIRKRLGVFAAAGMIGLWSFSPLVLSHSRMGFYIAASVFHGTACFAALLWFYDRWDIRSAVWLGGLLGASLYFYQLSWFVPVMAALVCVATPELWRRPRRIRSLLVVAGSALFVALPGVVGMREGLTKVLSQTVSKRIQGISDGPGGTLAYFVGPKHAGPDTASEFAERLGGDGLHGLHGRHELKVNHIPQENRPVIQVTGPPRALKAAIDTAQQSDWIALSQVAFLGGPWTRLSATFSMLFFKPYWQLMGRFIDAPVLNPFIAPFIVLGLCEAFRRRRQFVFRVLFVWVLVGAVVPAVVGTPFPRRTVLMLPFVYSLAAMPLIEVVRSRAGGRMGALALVAAFSLAVATTGSHMYFQRWDQAVVADAVPGLLRFAKTIKGVPSTERILTPRTYGRGWWRHVTKFKYGKRGGVTQVDAKTREDIREISCGLTPPFTWAVPRQQEVPDRYRVLSDDFRVDEEMHPTYTLFRITGRKPGACFVRRTRRD